MAQLDLFNYANEVPEFTEQISTPQVTPFTTPSTTSQMQPPSPEFTIERNPSPLKGFRVVQAPGLTHVAPKNPCRSCGSDGVYSSCRRCPMKRRYLDEIGVGGLRVAIDGDETYGC